MHTQLLKPDTSSSFKSQQDILARLLPYHIYAEPEAPPAAVEKGVVPSVCHACSSFNCSQCKTSLVSLIFTMTVATSYLSGGFIRHDYNMNMNATIPCALTCSKGYSDVLVFDATLLLLQRMQCLRAWLRYCSLGARD